MLEGPEAHGPGVQRVGFSALVETTPGGTGIPGAPSVGLRHDARSLFLPQSSFFGSFISILLSMFHLSICFGLRHGGVAMGSEMAEFLAGKSEEQ